MGNSESQLELDIWTMSNSSETKRMPQTPSIPSTPPNNNRQNNSIESIDESNQHFSSVPPSIRLYNKYNSISIDTTTTIMSSPNTTTSTSTYALNATSKLLYYMDTNALASLIKYMMETEAYFIKCRHESLNIYNAFITHKIRGKMLVKYTNVEFCNKLPWIRTAITSLIYDRLCSLADDDIEIYLSNINKYNSLSDTPNYNITMQLPNYLQQIDITTAHADTFPLRLCTKYELQIFVYILCISNDYNEIETKILLDALDKLNINGEQFMELKRPEFYRKLKPYNIKGGYASKLYKALIANSHNIYEYIRKKNISIVINDTNQINNTKPDKEYREENELNEVSTHKSYNPDVVDELVGLKYGTKNECINASEMSVNYWDINEVAENLNKTSKNVGNVGNVDIEDCDKENFNVFIENICHMNRYNRDDIESILEALGDINGKQFINMKRTHFVRKIKNKGIKGAVASKLHKLIMQHKENVCVYLNGEINDDNNKDVISITSHVLSNSTDISVSGYSNTPMSIDTIPPIPDISDIPHNQQLQDYNICIITEYDSEMNNKNATKQSSENKKYNKDIINVSQCNEKEFLIFVRNICIKNKFDKTDIESIINALNKINMNGEQFMTLRRVVFGRQLKEHNIKGAVSSKIYKLIMANHENISEYMEDNHINTDIRSIETENVTENKIELSADELSGGLSAVEIGEAAVNDFQSSAKKMLVKMNELMKDNCVNGAVLFEHCQNKYNLTIYLKENVIKKSVNVLVDLLWNKIDETIKEYTRKELLKYFISLYMYHIKNVIVKYDLNENKCFLLKRKAVCDILRKECGFTIGIATNIVDTIYRKIAK